MNTWTHEEIEQHRAAFLAALRSGKYIQGFGSLAQLNDTMQYCCLGVACSVAMHDGVVTRQKYFEQPIFKYGVLDKEDWSTGVLPSAVMDWLGIASNDPILVQDARNTDPLNKTLTAVMLNDDLKLPFPQIADLFEYFFANGGAA
jgi:hypothetical protein